MAAMNLDARWTEIARRLLLGRRIVAVGYMPPPEAAAHGWSQRGLVLTLDDGTVVYPTMDAEGNGPGVLFTTNEENPVLPVL